LTKLLKKTPGLTNHKQRTRIEAQLSELVENHNKLAMATQQIYEAVRQDINNVVLKIQAIARVVGDDKVNAEVQKIVIENHEKDVAANTKIVEEGLADGQLVVKDVIEKDSDCLIVGSITDKDGVVVHPTKTYVRLSQYKPEFTELLLGKTVGDTLTLEDGSTLKVLELYTQVAKPVDHSLN